MGQRQRGVGAELAARGGLAGGAAGHQDGRAVVVAVHGGRRHRRQRLQAVASLRGNISFTRNNILNNKLKFLKKNISK